MQTSALSEEVAEGFRRAQEGADPWFHFAGDYTISGSEVVVTVVSERYEEGPRSLWDTYAGVELELRGAVGDQAMVLKGHLLGEATEGRMVAALRRLTSW